MGKAKHKEITSRKGEHQRRKRGRETDLTEFGAYLDVLGLKIVQVTPDGNCFFRALADQLEGDEDEHEKYRNLVVQFIKNNREMFEPFVEDEVPFDEYCQSMGQEGNWAGQMELQAASLVTHCNICIHRYMSPRWYMKNFDGAEARMIHLSYHDGEHYNSVRCKDDTCSGPARPLVIEALNAGCDAKKEVLEENQICGDRMVSIDKIPRLAVDISYDKHQKMMDEHDKSKDIDEAFEPDLSYNGAESVHGKAIHVEQDIDRPKSRKNRRRDRIPFNPTEGRLRVAHYASNTSSS